MEILVCARRVPDTSENEIELSAAGNDIERDELVYSVNEADNYAVEEALQIRDRVGGKVTVVTVDNEEGEEILRRQLAMGANQSVLLSDESFEGSDGKGIATILKAFVDKGHYDLILTGVQADDGAAQVGRNAGRDARLSLRILGELHHGSRRQAESESRDRRWQPRDQ